ncbi:hypothetical protein PSHT_05875 [Puccinia striiformis]|uniref:Uncharacterized protein n=1 Tax=Puccinia striiformis TaxID=27350 RepID=A0A2S4W9H3_9BASI|nr:hypothetical protein PSHT_05875 [Puccinia striiformis]
MAEPANCTGTQAYFCDHCKVKRTKTSTPSLCARAARSAHPPPQSMTKSNFSSSRKRKNYSLTNLNSQDRKRLAYSAESSEFLLDHPSSRSNHDDHASPQNRESNDSQSNKTNQPELLKRITLPSEGKNSPDSYKVYAKEERSHYSFNSISSSSTYYHLNHYQELSFSHPHKDTKAVINSKTEQILLPLVQANPLATATPDGHLEVLLVMFLPVELLVSQPK